MQSTALQNTVLLGADSPESSSNAGLSTTNITIIEKKISEVKVKYNQKQQCK